MTNIPLDNSKMLGFRLLSAEETSGEAVVMGGKSGKTMNGMVSEDIVCDAMAISAKFGKEGKGVGIADAMVLSGKFGKVGKIRP